MPNRAGRNERAVHEVAGVASSRLAQLEVIMTVRPG